MKITIAAAALLFLAGPTWAQDAAHAQHHPQAPSAAPADKVPAESASGKMDMMKHCKMMQGPGDAGNRAQSMDKKMDCPMHKEKPHAP